MSNDAQTTPMITENLQPLRDLDASLRRIWREVKVWRKEIEKSDHLEPTLVVAFPGDFVVPQAERRLERLFGTKLPRLVKSNPADTAITWVDVVCAKLSEIDFVPQGNGFYRCKVKGVLVEITSENRDDLLGDFCLGMITKPCSEAGEKLVRGSTCEALGELSRVAAEVTVDLSRSRHILLNPSTSGSARAGNSSLPDPPVKQTPNKPTTPDNESKSSMLPVGLPLKRPTASPDVELPNKKRNGVIIENNTPSRSLEEYIPRNGDIDPDSEAESSGGDWPHNSNKPDNEIHYRRNQTNRVATSPRVTKPTSSGASLPVSTNKPHDPTKAGNGIRSQVNRPTTVTSSPRVTKPTSSGASLPVSTNNPHGSNKAGNDVRSQVNQPTTVASSPRVTKPTSSAPLPFSTNNPHNSNKTGNDIRSRPNQTSTAAASHRVTKASSSGASLPVSTNRVAEGSGTQRKGRPYNENELTKGKRWLRHWLGKGYSHRKIEYLWNKTFPGCSRTIRGLREKFPREFQNTWARI
ncbi:unnamed protein product [Penicillium bialowiezense]